MKHFGDFKTFNDAYWPLVSGVRAQGFWCTPRQQPCQELRPASFTLLRPDKAVYTGTERKLNFRLVMVEALGYISGCGDDRFAKLACGVNPNMQQFVNTQTCRFDGAYGPRLADGLKKAYESLKRDPWTRQAVASIWNNEENRNTVDLPCTLSMHFYCTPVGEQDNMDGIELSMHVTMRSNDLNWGTPYDVAAFCEIQCRMACALGIPVGSYHHTAGSLHYYRDTPPCVSPEPESTQASIRADDADLYNSLVEPTEGGWERVVADANKAIDGLWDEYYSRRNFQLKQPFERLDVGGQAAWVARLMDRAAAKR